MVGNGRIEGSIYRIEFINLNSYFVDVEQLQIVNKMRNNNFSSENAEAKSYALPICQVIDWF